MLDGHWVSGVFDRVVVHGSDDGMPLSASIYDFKTDHASVAEIEERYAVQMEVYRKAVCRLLSLSPDCVKSQILRVR
jgi:ATP-dependent exoDNAse (exonuclease V) beta subunit